MEFYLHYVEQGKGEPLVLLHGNGEDSSYFDAQLAYFSKRYRVIAVDTRGHGNSPRGEGALTLSRCADDLETLLDRLGLEQVNLLGFSDGGNIALLFALRYPARVRRLILNGANLSPEGVKRRIQFPIVLGYALISFIARWDPKAVAKREILGLMVCEPHIDPAELTRLNFPVLVIAGTKDMIRTQHTQCIAAAIPGARLVLLPGDHFIAAKRSEAFNHAVDSFLNDTAVAALDGKKR